MKVPKPSHAEQVALFRISVIGDLLAQELEPGALTAELEARSKKRYRLPGADHTRTFHAKTLQRWYYAAKRDLAAGLVPKSRKKGFAIGISEDQRETLLDMRREHPSAPAEIIRAEAIRHGVVAEEALSLSTLRRLYRATDLPRVSRKKADRPSDVQRRRWQAAAAGELWHGDVCHLRLLDERGDPCRLYVHGLLDDSSRFSPALVPREHEREQDMLEIFCGALLRHPPPSTLYLDNGSCYRGDVLQLVCSRLGIRLVHAQPYSPEARGKMERFWRSMRQRCTDHLPPRSTPHQVAQALWAWLDADYHLRPHAGLLGDTPRHRACISESTADGLPSARVLPWWRPEVIEGDGDDALRMGWVSFEPGFEAPNYLGGARAVRAPSVHWLPCTWRRSRRCIASSLRTSS